MILKSNFREIVMLVSFGLCLCAEIHGQISIIPSPKEIKLTGETLDLSDSVIVISDNSEQSKIAAEEINGKIEKLGGKKLKVIMEENFDTSSGKNSIVLAVAGKSSLLKESGLDVPIDKPGIQGYVIERKKNLVFLAGSDPVGMMYAAVTFCSLLEKNAENKISAKDSSIRDWPDFMLRYTTPNRKVKPLSGESVVDANKRFIDWLFRHKINVFGNNLVGIPDDMAKDISDYAKARGIKVFGSLPRDKGKSVQAVARIGKVDKNDPRYADMVKHKGDYFTWSDDELLNAKANYIGEYCARRGINCILFHAVDGGGILDPELWSLRSKKCRERFGDDRAAADAHLINLINNVMKKHVPEIQILFVAYPYGPVYWDYNFMKRNPGLTEKIWKKNVIDYQKKLAKSLPENIYVTYWLGTCEIMDKVMAAYKKEQPLCVYFEYLNPAYQGYVCPAVRYIKTDFFKGRPEMVWSAGNKKFVPVQELLDIQYYWNVNTPGAGEFKTGIYSKSVSAEFYDITGKDEPAVITQKLIPEICENLWGKKHGNYMKKVFNNGLNPMLILNSAATLGRINRVRRNAGLPNLEMTEEWMKKQFDAAIIAWDAMKTVVESMKKPSDKDWSSRFIAFYYKDTALLKTISGARFYMLRAKRLRNEGKHDDALKTVNDAKSFLDKSCADLKASLNKVKRWPSLGISGNYFLASGEIETYKKFFTKFAEKLDKEKNLVVKPRKPGKVLKVAIFNSSGDKGSSAGAVETKQILDSVDDVEAEFICDLSLANLLDYDCLVFPQSILGISSDKDDYFNSIRRFVDDGGRGVIFYHDACGYKRGEFGEKTVFPEICVKGTYGGWKNNTYTVANTHPSVKNYKKGFETKHSYEDHIQIEPGPNADVIMKDKSDKPVVVAGKSGLGRVIYDGTIIYSGKEKKPIPEFDKKRLANSLNWLSGKTKGE